MRRTRAQNGDVQRPEEPSSEEIPSMTSQSDDMSTFTSSNSSSTTTHGATAPRIKMAMRNCTVCKQCPPKEPHAVFCCGSIYCHVCLVKLMRNAHQKKEQPQCVACNQAMGEKPPQRTQRARLTNEAVEGTKRAALRPEMTEGPPQKRQQSVDISNGPRPPPMLYPPMPQPMFGARSSPLVGGQNGMGMVQAAGPVGRSMDTTSKLAQELLAAKKANGNNGGQSWPPSNIPMAFPGRPQMTVQNGGLTSEDFHRGANGHPFLAANPNLVAPQPQNGSNGSLPSLPSGEQNEQARPQLAAVIKQEPPENDISPLPSLASGGIPINGNGIASNAAPNYLPSGPSSYIPSPLALQSNPHRSKLARQILFGEDLLPRQPDPFSLEALQEQELATSKAIAAQGETSKPIYGPACAICWDGSRDPMATLCCDKIFCRQCILEEIRMRKKCPACVKDLNPNDALETLVRPLTVSTPIKPAPQVNSQAPDLDVSKFRENFKHLDEYTLSVLINQLTEIREDKYKEKKNEPLRIVSMGIMDFVKKCKYEIATISRQMEAALQDKKFIDGGYARECSLYGKVFSAVAGAQPTSTLPSSDSGLSSGGALPSLESYVPTLTPDELAKNERLKKHFDTFCTLYFDVFNKYSIYSSEDPDFSAQNRVSAMVEVADGITKYATVKKIGTLNYDTEQNPSMSIVSSLEFDHTGNRFVVAGVTKKIKIFHFDSFLENPTKVQFPANQLVCQSKISNVSWSPDQDHILASSDYDGHVSVWDLENSKVVRTFKEHERRCWTVHFNNVEPKLMASGSDDSKVKLWNINVDRSVAQIEARVNVCCVYFSPTKSYELVFGSADHCVHLYDIRNTSRPVDVFKGHRKAVSYVRYINPNEVVSASTDSSLRVWNIREGKCTKILKGHMNEKNFVGLSGNGDHVMCGSENSRAFFYYKGLSEPVASYTVSNYSGPGKDTGTPGEAFVSSVCWKKDSDYAMVANSQGKVQLVHIA